LIPLSQSSGGGHILSWGGGPKTRVSFPRWPGPSPVDAGIYSFSLGPGKNYIRAWGNGGKTKKRGRAGPHHFFFNDISVPATFAFRIGSILEGARGTNRGRAHKKTGAFLAPFRGTPWGIPHNQKGNGPVKNKSDLFRGLNFKLRRGENWVKLSRQQEKKCKNRAEFQRGTTRGGWPAGVKEQSFFAKKK